MKFAVQTLFDITATGVTGHYKPARVPFRDHTNKIITDYESWNRARNQQRNWETLTQVLSLRTQLFRLQLPVVDMLNHAWMFEFEVEADNVYGPDTDPSSVLCDDAAGVPMLCGLDNRAELASMLITSGPDQNIWFVPLFINMSTGN
jgi:hypothetical protein